MCVCFCPSFCVYRMFGSWFCIFFCQSFRPHTLRTLVHTHSQRHTHTQVQQIRLHAQKCLKIFQPKMSRFHISLPCSIHRNTHTHTHTNTFVYGSTHNVYAKLQYFVKYNSLSCFRPFSAFLVFNNHDYFVLYSIVHRHSRSSHTNAKLFVCDYVLFIIKFRFSIY